MQQLWKVSGHIDQTEEAQRDKVSDNTTNKASTKATTATKRNTTPPITHAYPIHLLQPKYEWCGTSFFPPEPSVHESERVRTAQIYTKSTYIIYLSDKATYYRDNIHFDTLWATQHATRYFVSDQYMRGTQHVATTIPSVMLPVPYVRQAHVCASI